MKRVLLTMLCVLTPGMAFADDAKMWNEEVITPREFKALTIQLARLGFTPVSGTSLGKDSNKFKVRSGMNLCGAQKTAPGVLFVTVPHTKYHAATECLHKYNFGVTSYEFLPPKNDIRIFAERQTISRYGEYGNYFTLYLPSKVQ